MEILKRFLKNSYVEWKYRERYISISSSAEEIGNDCWICMLFFLRTLKLQMELLYFLER